MPVVNIDALPDVDMTLLDGTELFECLQGGVNKKMDLMSWFTILSGGGGLPSGSPYQVLQLEADGVTPAFGSVFYDNAGGYSIDIVNRTISDSSSYIVFDYQNRYLYNGWGHIGIDIGMGLLHDASGNPDIDVPNRKLYDQYMNPALDWHNGFQVPAWYKWAFNGLTPTVTETGWFGAGTYTPRLLFSDTSTVTLQELADLVGTLVNSLVVKGILSH